MDLDKAIKTRKSVRRYSEKKADWRDILKAIDMARFAPMAGNQFSLKFILVQDEEKIKRIGEATQQDFVGKAGAVVVVVSDDTKVVRSYGKEKGERFARQQAGAAIQNFLLKCNELGLATCWVGFYDDYIIHDVLEIPESFVVEAVFPVGKETKIKVPEKKKADLENYINFEKFGQNKMIPRYRTSVEAI